MTTRSGKTLRRLAVLVGLSLGTGVGSAFALTCSAVVSDINFGAISVRAGAVNRTSGSVQITCTGALVSPVGTCLRIGPGSGGAGPGNSPRYMRRGDGAALSYELRPTGNGAAFGTWTNVYVPVVVLLGSGSATVPIFADITSATVGVGTGTYQSVFSGTSDIQLSYGLATCSLLGTTTAVPPFTVSADVIASCELDVTALNFGNIGMALTQPVDATANVNVRCTQGTNYLVTMDMGGGPGASGPAQRKMTNGPNVLSYGIYRDATRVQPWGDTPAEAVAGVGTGANQSLPVYGRINAGQSPAAGIYNDSVVVTIAY